MSSPRYLPPSINYTKARFRPFAQPLFWLTAAILGLFFFALWQYGKQPDWLTSSDEQPETIANYTGNSTERNTKLAPEDLALLADIDNIDFLFKETELKPLQDNIINLAKKPKTSVENSQKTSKNLLEQLLEQKPTDLLTQTNSPLFQQKSGTSTNSVATKPLTTIKPVGNLPSLGDLGQRQQRSLAGENNLRRALNSYNTTTSNSAVREFPVGVTNATPVNNNFNRFSGQVNAPANPANPVQSTPGTPVTQPQPNSYIPGQPITSYPLQRPNNINNFNQVNIPNPYNNSGFTPNYTNPLYSSGINNYNYGLPANQNLPTPIPQPYNYGLPTRQNFPTSTTQPYRTQPYNYGLLANPNFSTPVPQLYNYGTQGTQRNQLPQNSRTNQSNLLYYYR